MTDSYTLQAEFFKALAHPVRLRILEVLSQGEASVSHLTNLLAQRQPYISQQLMQLRDAGLVLDRREGNTITYRLASPQVTYLIANAGPLSEGSQGEMPAHQVLPDTRAARPCTKWTPEED
jgi:DNA-binding transcriptional ArsR family regulator